MDICCPDRPRELKTGLPGLDSMTTRWLWKSAWLLMLKPPAAGEYMRCTCHAAAVGVGTLLYSNVQLSPTRHGCCCSSIA